MPGIKVLWSLDIEGLERRLLDRVAARPRGGLLDPLLVLVSTRRLGTYLKRRIAARTGAALGVHIFTHRGLAVRALECALEVPPRVLSSGTLGGLVEGLSERLSRGPRAALDQDDAAYLRAYPGVRAAILATIRDLRDAGVKAEELAAVASSRQDVPPLLPPIYAEYARTLRRLEAEGFTDSAGIVEKALPHIPDFLRRKGIRLVIHHGAYELIGIHTELLEALAKVAETEVLLPSEIEGPSFRYASRFVEMMRRRGAAVAPLARPGREETERGARRAWIERLRGLHVDADPPSASPAGLEERRPFGPRLEIRHSQGTRSELQAAALRALSLHAREGIALEDIAILARSLDPYRPFLEETLDQAGLPFTSSTSAPLSRDPQVAAFLALLLVLAEDLPRAKLIDLLRRPVLRGAIADRAGVDRRHLRVAVWDRASLEARIVSGPASWREVADRLAADGERSAAHLRAVVDLLDGERRAWGRASTHGEHAAALRALARKLLRVESAGEASAPGAASVGEGAEGPEPPDVPAGVERLIRAVEATGVVARAAGGDDVDSPLDLPSAASLARFLAEEEEVPVRAQDRGVRVLDIMQARGLRHRAVIWLGFHDGSFPRRARLDPFLGDEARAAIGAATQKPLLPKLDAEDEERVLLAVGLAACGDLLVLSFQRADEGGRRRARSGALREVARVFSGRPDARALLADSPDNPFRPDRISSHPGARAVEIATSPRVGLVVPLDAVVAGASLAPDGPAMARSLLGGLGVKLPGARSALAYLRRIDDYAPTISAFDGRTGIGLGEDRPLSPTAIEMLARCPLSFFLRHVLGLRELEEEPVPHRLEVRILGDAVHKTLAALYGELAAKEAFSGQRDALAIARDRLGALWRRELEAAAGPSAKRLAGLFEVLGDRWRDSLLAFLSEDLRDLMLERGESKLSLKVEESFRARVALAEGVGLTVEGRLDRILEIGGALRVDDYKTGGNVGAKADPKAALRGLHLQLPLYREAAAAQRGLHPSAVRARLLGVGPEFDEPDAAARSGRKERAADLELSEEERAGVLETVAAAIRLARGGRFPLLPEEGDLKYCSWCKYRRACRKDHEPTLERIESDPDLADLRDSRLKTREGPVLSEVRRSQKEKKSVPSGREKPKRGGEP